MMNRRQLLKLLGVGTAVAIVAPKLLLTPDDEEFEAVAQRYWPGWARPQVNRLMIQTGGLPRVVIDNQIEPAFVDIVRRRSGHETVIASLAVDPTLVTTVYTDTDGHYTDWYRYSYRGAGITAGMYSDPQPVTVPRA